MRDETGLRRAVTGLNQPQPDLGRDLTALVSLPRVLRVEMKPQAVRKDENPSFPYVGLPTGKPPPYSLTFFNRRESPR